MPGEHAGHRQRMRERFLKNGLEGFAEHEVLELLLFYAIPRQNTNPLAHRLLSRYGSLRGVMEAPAEELARVEGMGMGAAILLSLVFQLSRLLGTPHSGPRELVKTRGDAKQHCMHLLHGLRQEHFYVVCLDAQLRLIRDALIARGTVDEVHAYPRLVAEAILRYNAHSVILCHNHPGSNVLPSDQDMKVTRELVDLCSGLGVAVLDHVIVSEEDAFSMVAHGLIQHKLKREDESAQPRAAESGLKALVKTD